MATLLENWRNAAYGNGMNKNEQEALWQKYFSLEKGFYEKVLADPKKVYEGTVKELAERSIGRPLFLRTVRNAKFLHVIDPHQATEVTFPLAISRPDEGGVAVSCVVTDPVGTLFAKISLLLEEVKG